MSFVLVFLLFSCSLSAPDLDVMQLSALMLQLFLRFLANRTCCPLQDNTVHFAGDLWPLSLTLCLISLIYKLVNKLIMDFFFLKKRQIENMNQFFFFLECFVSVPKSNFYIPNSEKICCKYEVSTAAGVLTPATVC